MNNDVIVPINEHNHDQLVVRRLEIFFNPNEDGTPSVDGRLIWHTEWWHYSGTLLRGASLGPQISVPVEEMLAEEYAVDERMIAAPEVIEAMKVAFAKRARVHLGQPEPEEEIPAESE